MNKLKVVVEFSVYNKDYKQPKMEAKLDKKTGYIYIYNDDFTCGLSNDEDKSNPLYIKFKANDILEVKEIFVCHNLKSYVYITFNNKTYEIPIEVLNFCTEKL